MRALAVWRHGRGPVERLRADAQHAIGLGDLGVDEHRDERAEERAAAIEAAAGALRLSQRRTSASVSFETGLSSTCIASRKTCSYGSMREPRDREVLDRGQQLERLGLALLLERACAAGLVEPKLVDLVPQVVDAPARWISRNATGSVESLRVDPDPDHDRRREAASTAPRTRRCRTASRCGRRGRRDREVVAALDEAHAAGLGLVVVVGARGRATSSERAATATQRGLHRSRPSAFAIVSSKIADVGVDADAGVDVEVDRQRAPHARRRARAGRRSRRGPTARRRRTGRRRRRASCPCRGTAASAYSTVARAAEVAVASACRRACRGCRAAPASTARGRARAASACGRRRRCGSDRSAARRR